VAERNRGSAEMKDNFHTLLNRFEGPKLLIPPDNHTLLEALKVSYLALSFYEDPPKRDEDGEPLSLPDFYNEMDFGDRAREAKNKILKILEGE